MNIPPSPLAALHEQAGAEIQPYDALSVVSTFGEPESEYAALHKAAAVFDFAQRGILQLTGRDRLAFLNNLLTNQTWSKDTKTPMPSGTGVYAFFLNLKGRIVADMNVLDLGDRTLLEMDVRRVEPVRKAFDKFLFVEQVKMTSRVGSLSELFLSGPASQTVLDSQLDAPLGDLPPLGCVSRKILSTDVVVWRDDLCAHPGFHLVVDTAAAPALWQHLTTSPPADPSSSQFARFRGLARPSGWAAFNAARIEAGRPLFGIDLAEPPPDNDAAGILPAETGLFDRAVSVTKGCYLGQEIVARMYARQQVARQLVGLRIADDALPLAGTKLYDASENEIGAITSSTISPILSNASIALGYLKKPFFAEGTQVRVPAEGQMRQATVVKLPFFTP